jgi:lipoprotein NlpI
MLLRDCQIAQHIAVNPTMCKFEFLGIYYTAQTQYWEMLVGLQLAPMTHAIKLQTYLAR